MSIPTAALPDQRSWTRPVRHEVLLGAVAFIIALVATDSVAMACAAAVGAAVLPLALTDGQFVTMIYAAFLAAQLADPASLNGIPAPFVLATAGAVFHLLRAFERRTLRLGLGPIQLFAFIYIVTRSIGVFVADDSVAAQTQIVQLLKDFLALVVLSALFATFGGTKNAIKAIVITLAGLGLLAAAQEWLIPSIGTAAGLQQFGAATDVGSTTARHAGPIRDANFWARIVVTFVPLAIGLVIVSKRRIGWMLVATGGILAAVLSQSRGGFIALGIGVVVCLLAAGWRTTIVMLLTPLVAVVALVNPLTGPRIQTLFQLGQSKVTEDESLSDRSSAAVLGMAMFEDHPMFGVGIANFEGNVPEYQRKTGRDLNTVKTGQGIAAHNTYVQVLAESGVVGILGWLLFLGAMTMACVRALRTVTLLQPVTSLAVDRTMIAGLLGGLVAYAIASLFLHQVLLSSVFVLAAMINDLDRSYSELVVTARSTVKRARVPVRLGLPMLAGAGVSVALFMALPVTSPRALSVRTANVSVIPAAQGWLTAYQLELASSRLSVLRTLAAVADTRDLRREVAAATGIGDERLAEMTTETVSERNSILTLAVRGPDRAVASKFADALIVRGVAEVNGLKSIFVLQALPDQTLDLTERERSYRWSGVALLPLVIGLSITARWLYRQRQSAGVASITGPQTWWFR